MGDRLADILTHKRDAALALIEQLSAVAVDEGRDLTDQDMQTITAKNDEVKNYNRQLAVLCDDLELAEGTQARLRGLGSAVVAGDFHYRSAGDLLWDCLHQTEPEAKQRYRRVMRRAAEHMGTTAAATTPVAGDLAGLAVRPVVGPVSDPTPKGMPFATALGMRDIPASDGFGFSRPYLVDDGFATGVAKQTLEKAELASKAFSVAVTNVPLDTVGGYLNISQQLLTFTPSSLQIIVSQLTRRLENHVDKAVVAEMQESTGEVALAAGATAAEVIQAIYDAAAAYYGVTGELPSWIAMGPLGWARLGGLVDAAGRPMFPTLGASNAPGSMSATSFSVTVAGLTPVVTAAITDDTYWVGGDAGLEGYMYRYPVLEAVEPSVLGRQVAVAASIAGYRPTPFANATIHVGPAV
jgi:HK97 family phage major capsid protein